MAEIPRYFARASVPSVNLQGEGAAMGAFARGVSALGDAFGKIDEAAIEAESRRLQMETAAKIREKMILTKQEQADPEVYASFAASGIEEIRREALGRATNEKVRKRLEDYLSPAIMNAQTDVKYTRREKQIEGARGNSVLIVDQAKRDITAAMDPKRRDEIERQVEEHLGNMVNVQAYSPKEAAAMMVRFRHEGDKERLSVLTESQPKWIQANATPENFPRLSNEELNAAKRRAGIIIREEEAEAKRVQKEKMDQASLELLNTTAQNGANLGKMREQILRRADLDFDTKRFWIDRLDRQIEAREREREKGEADPFKKSDGATLARVFKTILEKPEGISTVEISGLMGKGLSVPDALRAASMLEERKKKAEGPALPAAMDPLNMAFKNWDRMRGQSSFLPEVAAGTKMTPEQAALNDSRANEVWQTVIDRVMANPNQDPQKVLNEVMQPFYEEKVQGFFGRTFSALNPFRAEAPSKDERIAARQFLVRAGKEPTEENINKALDHFKKKRSAPKDY